MRKFLLLAFLVGCGTSSPVDVTTWNVTLGNWQAPTCQGSMTLGPNDTVEPRGMPPALTGNWTCGTFGTQASGTIQADKSLFFDLETTPGFLNRVVGTLASEDAIAGDITLDQQQVPFAAYRQ